MVQTAEPHSLHPQSLPTSPTCPWFSQSWQTSNHPSKPSSHITSSETFLIPSPKENPSLTPLFFQSSLFRALFRALLAGRTVSPKRLGAPQEHTGSFPQCKPTSCQQASVSPCRSAGPCPDTGLACVPMGHAAKLGIVVAPEPASPID